jgi:hypothetical protein
MWRRPSLGALGAFEQWAEAWRGRHLRLHCQPALSKTRSAFALFRLTVPCGNRASSHMGFNRRKLEAEQGHAAQKKAAERRRDRRAGA